MINPKFIELRQEINKLEEEWKKKSPLRLIFEKYIEGNEDFTQAKGVEAFVLRAALLGEKLEIIPDALSLATGEKKRWDERWSIWLNKKDERVVMLEKWTSLTAARARFGELQTITTVKMEGLGISAVQLSEVLNVAGACHKHIETDYSNMTEAEQRREMRKFWQDMSESVNKRGIGLPYDPKNPPPLDMP